MREAQQLAVYGFDLARMPGYYNDIHGYLTNQILRNIERDIFSLYSKDGVDGHPPPRAG